jgi:hypothetical protein
MIQDFVILAAQGTMLLFLIPTLRSPAHWPKTITSAVTSLCLFAMAISFATLSLWLSAATTAAIGAAWGYMAMGSFFRQR